MQHGIRNTCTINFFCLYMDIFTPISETNTPSQICYSAKEMNMVTSFTAEQRRELELQWLIFNCMASGLPVPPHLLFLLRRSLLLKPAVLLRNPFWIQQRTVKYDGRIQEHDAEPWRCRRMDGKKWRCSKRKVASDENESKYCEKHMHRGSKSSRMHEELTPLPLPLPRPPRPLPPLSVLRDSTATSKFLIGFSTTENAAASRKQDDARDNAEDRLEDDKVGGTGVGLGSEKPAEAEKKKEEKPAYIYLFNKRIEIV